MASTWRTVRVFISSTFRDMHAERDQLVKVVDFRGMMQLPAIAFLQLSLLHSSHHRGQLSTYLRPMGAKVPAIYGESYDSAKAKAGA